MSVLEDDVHALRRELRKADELVQEARRLLLLASPPATLSDPVQWSNDLGRWLKKFENSV